MQISLLGKYGNGKFALVDDEDYVLLDKYKWYMSKSGYVWSSQCAKEHEIYYLHRIIMNDPSGYEIDHINNNRLDNRKTNLRICNHSENSKNKTRQTGNNGYKGVYQRNDRRGYKVEIMVDGEKIFIGTFSSEIAAANAYNHYAKLHHGEFANLNDVDYMNIEEWESCRISKSRTSQYNGVSRQRKNWRAGLTVNGEYKYSKVFKNEEDAAREFDRMVLLYGGDVSLLNFTNPLE